RRVLFRSRPGSRHSHHTDPPDHAAAGSHLPGPAHPRPRCAPCGRHLSPLTTRLTLEEVHMRNNLFKLTAAAGVLALTLTACGSDGDGETDGALAGEGSGDDCVIEGEVPVGAALSLTGAAASYGESQKAGLELAAEALNEKEGVTYKLTIEDDQTD